MTAPVVTVALPPWDRQPDETSQQWADRHLHEWQRERHHVARRDPDAARTMEDAE